MAKSGINRVLIIYSLLGFFLPQGHLKMAATGIGLIIVSCLIVVKSIKNKNAPFLVISVFFSSYCLAPVGYLLGLQEHIIENITTAENQSTVFLAAHCLLTFMSFFLYYTKFDIPIESKTRKTYMSIYNPIGYYICVLISILCIALGLSGNNIFESGGYANAVGESDRSSLFEYCIIFLALALIYSRKHSQRILIYVLCFVYIMEDLLYGGRISSAMLILTVFLLQFLNKFSFKWVLVAIACGYIFLNFWGYFRSGMSGEGFNVMAADGNAQFVTYAAMRIHYMIDVGILNWPNRIISFVSFLLSSFIPKSYLPDIANLSMFMQSDYYTGGGGLVSTFFYCWAWIPGVGAIAIWIGKVFNKIFHSQSIYWKFYALLILITTPRWFAYYPMQIFKFAVYGLIVFFIINKFAPQSKLS